jgi:3-ketoacyl-CoA synthase
MINWTHVIAADAPKLMMFGILALVVSVIHQVVTDLELHRVPMTFETVTTVITAVMQLFQQLYTSFIELVQGLDLFSPAVKTTFLLLCFGAYMMRRRSPVYLMSFATFKAPDSWKMTHAQICEIMRKQKCFTEESLGFMERILERSGTGQATAWPPGIVQSLKGLESDRSIDGARKEAQTIIFDTVDQAWKKAAVHPREIENQGKWAGSKIVPM